MPKAKPCKGMRKRVRVTKTGKVVSISSGTGHRKAPKSAKRKRRLRRVRPLSPVAAKQAKKLLALK